MAAASTATRIEIAEHFPIPDSRTLQNVGVIFDGLRLRFLRFLDFRSRIAALLIGSGLIFWGYEEYRVGIGAAEGAEEVELERLESGYVPKNQHLRIGRHLRVYETIAYFSRGRNVRDPEVKYAYFPLFSKASPDGPKSRNSRFW